MLWLLSLVCLITWVQIPITFGYDIEDRFDAMEYLARFGYMEKSLINEMNMVDIRPYVLDFQHTFGINETGQLDQETLMMMNRPRCGCPDKSSPSLDSGRNKRYAFFRTKWADRKLVYRITRHMQFKSTDVSSVDRDVDQAFKMWSSVTNLEFIKATHNSQHVDIELKFVNQYHDDQYPFDGPGSTLAHAFAPERGLGGDVHYDSHEDWTTGSGKGINVLWVSVHEIGHALGLAHSSTRGSIMEAYYVGYRPNLKLHDDDIQGIQKLYGVKSSNKLSFPGPENRTTTSLPSLNRTGSDESVKDICQDPKLDAITTSSNGAIYLFKDKYVYQIDADGGGVLPYWPNRIEYIFRGLHSSIDAALTRQKIGSTYFFKHDKFWRFNGTEMDPGYPKEIARHFPSIPDNLDAAFESPQNELLFFLKGDRYWVFDPNGKPHVSSKYPLPISTIGLHNVDSIDGAFVSPQGKIYLFANNQYWRLDDDVFSIYRANPTYTSYTRDPFKNTLVGDSSKDKLFRDSSKDKLFRDSSKDKLFRDSSKDKLFRDSSKDKLFKDFFKDRFRSLFTDAIGVARAYPRYPRDFRSTWLKC